MAVNVGMVSLGCSKNQVDGELMLSLVLEEGYTLCADAAQCDVVIINTCAFIEDAKREAIETILEFCQLKGEGRVKAVVVTGCLAERYQKELAAEIPEVDVILGIGRNQQIAQSIRRALAGERVVEFGGKEELSLEGNRVLANAPYFAYVKLADGCDNRCTYCAIPGIRGHFRSRPMEKVLEEVERLAKSGVREVNLVAQDTTRYGEDIYGTLVLPELIHKVCAVDGITWVRILYCYPERIDDALLEAMAAEPKVVPYMDMPIQHASGTVLRRMNRRGDVNTLRELVAKVRRVLPGAVLRTTVITGFPGETEEEFAELCDFVREARFERLGCFTYSLEEDTPAALMAQQIDEEVKIARAETIMAEQMGIAEAFNQSCVGRELQVMVEGYDKAQGLYYGRSYMDAPDIDTRTYFESHRHLHPGDFAQVDITGWEGYDLLGRARD